MSGLTGIGMIDVLIGCTGKPETTVTGTDVETGEKVTVVIKND